MKKLLLGIFILFNACSIKPIINKDPIYEQTLKYTQRGQIINSLETKAIIDVIYLNKLYNFKNPTFLIGVYNYTNSLINNEFKLTLNNKNPIKISKKIPKNILYKNFPFYNEWKHYYIVSFPKTNKPYVIKYKSKHWGEVKFIF